MRAFDNAMVQVSSRMEIGLLKLKGGGGDEDGVGALMLPDLFVPKVTHMHAGTPASTHALTHARTHARTHTTRAHHRITLHFTVVAL
jgi:hypothetical protein